MRSMQVFQMIENFITTLVEEQNAIQEQNFKQSKEQKEQRRLLEDKKTQLAEAQQTILQISTENVQKMILSNKAERLIANSPMMFRCSDCFERLYVQRTVHTKHQKLHNWIRKV